MRPRLLAASAIGAMSLLQGLVLVRLAAFQASPVAALVTVANVGATLIYPSTASAAMTAGNRAVLRAEGMSALRAVASEQASDSAQTILAADSLAPVDVSGSGASATSACPAGMLLVEGDYCPEVLHECKTWLESEGRYAFFRCAEYTSAKCLSKEREHKRFCMDRDEYAPAGEQLPASHVSWNDATRTCGSLGKRVCLESEWNFACEGEEMRPYPYGWKRDAEACNADRTDLYRGDGQLRDLRVGASDNPRCVSPFGIHNLSGNLEEWTTIDASAGGTSPRPAMKGAYWQPSRNQCRAAQTAHDRFYNGTETGFRCCL